MSRPTPKRPIRWGAVASRSDSIFCVQLGEFPIEALDAVGQ